MYGLDKRLQMLFSCIESCHCVADIGTDHGFLPIALLKAEKCTKAIACDISAPSLSKAEKNSRIQGVDLECRLSDGLAQLKENEADCIVIAGMGGILISEILEREKEKALNATLVLQPMTAVKELREYLCQNGFMIQSEDMVFCDGKLYHAIVTKRGQTKEYDCEIGTKLRNHPLFKEYLALRIKKEETILNQMGLFRGEQYEFHKQLLEKLKQEEQ